MKTILFIFLFVPVVLTGQSLVIFTKHSSFTTVKHYYERQCKSHKKNCGITSKDDTLKIQIPGKDSFTMNFLFDPILHRCVFQEIIFSCNNCIDKHIKDLLNLKLYKWKKISENKYLSNYYKQTEMHIKTDKVSERCLIIQFYLINKPRKEYIKYYKLL